MPRKVSLEALFRKYLSKTNADKLLAKIDQMIATKKDACTIEETIAGEMSKLVEAQIFDAVTKGFGPLDHDTRHRIQVNIGERIQPIGLNRYIQPSVRVSIAVGPKKPG